MSDWRTDKAIDWMMADIGVPREHYGTVQKYMDDVAMIESDRDGKRSDPGSSAKGLFMWLNGDNHGQPGTNSFVEDLEAAELYYKKSGAKVPQWIDDAYKHNDPRKLTDKEAEKLFLFRMYRWEKNEKLLKAYTGDREQQRRTYFSKHHTNPDNPTVVRVNKFLPPDPAATAGTFKEALNGS